MRNESMLEYLSTLLEDVEFPDSWCAVLGDIGTGFVVHGPFMNKHEAIRWAESHTADESSWDVLRLYGVNDDG